MLRRMMTDVDFLPTRSALLLAFVFHILCLGGMADETGTSPDTPPPTGEKQAKAGTVRGPLPPLPPKHWPWENDEAFAEKREHAIKLIQDNGGEIRFRENAKEWWGRSSYGRPFPADVDVHAGGRLISDLAFAETYITGEIDTVPKDVNDELLTAILPYVPEIKHLTLSLTMVTDKGLANIKHLPYLETLMLEYRWTDQYPVLITDAGMKPIGEHPNLWEVQLYGMPITDQGIAHLAHSRTIRALSIHGCPITSKCFLSLATMPSLGSLNTSRYLPPGIPESYRQDFSQPISEEVARAIESLDGRLVFLRMLRMKEGDVHPSFLEAVSKMRSLKHYMGLPLPTNAKEEGLEAK